MKLITENWQLIAGIVTPIATFLGGWKLKKINEKKEGAGALEAIQKVYDTFTTQTDKKIDELFAEIKTLKEENIEQRRDIRSLHKDNSKMEKQITALTLENAELKRLVADLQAENERLKKNKVSK